MGLNQFHDILPGSAIAWVHRQARADYVRDIARLRDIAAEAGASIASVRDDADMRSNAAIVPYTAKNGVELVQPHSKEWWGNFVVSFHEIFCVRNHSKPARRAICGHAPQ